jgi:hypothetical protein
MVTGTVAHARSFTAKGLFLVLGLAGAGVLGACGGGEDTNSDGDATGDVGTGGVGTGDVGTGDVGTGDVGTGGADGASGGSSSTTDACSPDMSSQFVPCDTNTEVPTLTEDFSIIGPFSPGDTVAVSVAASSGLGITVQAYTEPASCSDSMTLISEQVVPNADQTCVEVTVTEATASVHWLLVQDTVSPARLFAVCGQCP